MKHQKARKIISFISSFSLLFQTFLPLTIAMPAYADEATDSAVVEVTPTPEITPEVTPEPTLTVEPTPEVTPEVTPTVEITPEITPEPTVEITPEPTVTPEATPEATPTEEVAPEEVQNNSPPSEDQSSSDTTPSEPTPEATLPADLTIVAQLEQTVIPEVSPSLSTDKSDYFPTDTVYITGVNFLPNTAYTLHIYSSNNPAFDINPDVTSGENGNVSYSFRLDGNYRPSYSIEALDQNGQIVTAMSFTDTPVTNTLPVCHATSSNSNPYELITPDISGVESGHRDHNGGVYPANPWGDIFPPYSYTTNECPANDSDYTSTNNTKPCSRFYNVIGDGNPNKVWRYADTVTVTHSYSGKNWDTNGQYIYNHGCQVSQPDLVVSKTNSVNGTTVKNSTFVWTLTVSNNGNASAEFNNENILRDNLPDNATYSPTSNMPVTVSGGTTGTVDCDINYSSGHYYLDCDDDSGGSTVIIPAGGSFVVNISVTPTQVATYNNPRSGQICRVDPDGEITESDDTNNNCSNSVIVTNPTGKIFGYKFNDRNGNRTWDQGTEEGLSGWTIYVDLDGDNRKDTGESFAVTDATGYYEITGLQYDDYRVKEVAQTNWNQTTPNDPTYHYVDLDSASEGPKNFGNKSTLGSIKVCKVIIDGNSNIVNGSQMPATTFTINWTGGNGLAPTVINSGYLPNTKIFSDSPSEDAYCVDYPNIPLANYGYSQEIISTSGWETPKYNDQFNSTVLDLGDFKNYHTPGDENSNGYMDLTNQAGPDRTLVILNEYELGGTINVTKYNDLDGDGNQDDGEGTMDGWEINLSGYTSINTVNGVASFIDITPGTYTLSETQQDGWTQTGISCSNAQQEISCDSREWSRESCEEGPSTDMSCYGEKWSFCGQQYGCDFSDDATHAWSCPNLSYNPFVRQVNAGTQLPEGSIRVSVGNDETVNCSIGNQRNDPTLKISRSNNAGAPLSPGSSVEHTITIKVLGNSVESLTLTDLLPDGFKFRAGSYSVTRNGNPVTLLTDPVYNSPGEWELGSYEENDEIVIKYLADISSDINPGNYTDLAWALANNDILAVGENSEYVDGYFVGTDVEVVKDQTSGGTYDVEKKVEGEVLGASTSLPATGASPMWPMLAFVCLVYGIRFIKSSNKK